MASILQRPSQTHAFPESVRSTRAYSPGRQQYVSSDGRIYVEAAAQDMPSRSHAPGSSSPPSVYVVPVRDRDQAYSPSQEQYTPLKVSYTNTTVEGSSRTRVDERVQGLARKPNVPAGHMLAWLGEFAGTFQFMFLGYAGNLVGANRGPMAPTGGPTTDTVFFIAASYGFAVMTTVWIFMRVSGSNFNPAVTLGLVIAGALEPIRAAIMLTGQVLGSIVAGFAVSALFSGQIAQANTTLGSGTTVVQGLFMELFLTAQLVGTVLFVGSEKSKDSAVVPIAVGMTIFVDAMVSIPHTGASMNPIRSLGCAAASGQFVSEHWIYWLGPLLGGALAAALFRFVKFFKDKEGPWEPAEAYRVLPAPAEKSVEKSW